MTPSPASPFLYFVDDRLSPAELSAARLDGHLVELGDAYIPADAVETSGLRAGSLRGILGDTLAATHLTAAWVHGALSEPPARHTVQRAVAKRLHHVMGRRILYRDGAIEQDDLQVLGGVLVTSPVRTLADLARVPDDSHAEAARLLADAHPGLASDAIAWLNAHGSLPHKRSALAFLRGLAERDRATAPRAGRQDDVTR
ncbi:hypothetical protein [Microbacterium ulmi]|uniref:hypothetical protein n=1 Tax=Microbacterium ulmi TaxID=179095 RepID=UPI0031334F6E|nr:hypothetical protein [Microbacterium ulmi]